MINSISEMEDQNFYSINQLSREAILQIIQSSHSLRLAEEKIIKRGGRLGEEIPKILLNQLIYLLFFEDSTRTSGSFATAALNLGAKIYNPNFATSSLNKGETYEDTIAMFAGWHPRIIIERHKDDDFTEKMAKLYPDASHINAGNGKKEHPTQTLLDLTTIYRFKGEISNCKIAFFGDIKDGRTPKSLALALDKFENNEIIFVALKGLAPDDNFLKQLKGKVSVVGMDKYEEVCKYVEFGYFTRVQKERKENSEISEDLKQLDAKIMQKIVKVNPDFKVMHPLPIDNSNDFPEIHPEVFRKFPKNAIFYFQAELGVPVRMILMAAILGKFKILEKWIDEVE